MVNPQNRKTVRFDKKMKGANIHAETDFNCPARHPLGNRNGIDSDQSNRLTPDTRKRGVTCQ